MSDEMLFHFGLDLTALQTEMVAQLMYSGLAARLNGGWRHPEEWLALTSKISAALELGRSALEPGLRPKERKA